MKNNKEPKIEKKYGKLRVTTGKGYYPIKTRKEGLEIIERWKKQEEYFRKYKI